MKLAVVVSTYRLLYSNSRPLSILVKFLTDDVGLRRIDSIVNWINDEKYKSVVLNACYLVKHDEKINIYFFYDGYGREETEKREKFEISKDELVKVIKKWKVDYIDVPLSSLIITVDNGKVIFDPREWREI